MDQQRTCGRGLAGNSLLPGKLGELAVAMAENLETGLPAIANEMARDLQMGLHVLPAFEKFVQVKQELFALVQQTTERDQSLLLEMRSLRAHCITRRPLVGAPHLQN